MTEEDITAMSRSEEDWKAYVAQKLRENDEGMTAMKDQMDLMKRHMESVQQQLDLVTAIDSKQSAAIDTLVANTAEILEVFSSWKGAMKVLDYLGKIAKPIGYIVALGASLMAVWTAYRTGVSPK
jgi:hypothetical protein